ncbi:phosphoglycolate phosphatase-like protein [Leptotrombidium deliense]|uniref:Phosphoglycolate phosphatase-like protein n=1 Tax=Leptotrombidium deliense TaxID=299467 RepID=A0A443SLC0_9ACAR|nr:phosphoglycolate phosphatase-like protein [Leptotrombidium deliense]
MISFPVNLDDSKECAKLLDEIDFVVVDCDGVLWLNMSLLPGCDRTINVLRKNGKKIIFATNNSSKSRQEMLKKLNDMGFNATIDEVMITSFALCVYLKQMNFSGKVYIFGNVNGGTRGIADELTAAGIECTGVGKDPMANDGDMFPNVTLDCDVKAVVVAYDNYISLPKLVKACTYARTVDPRFFIATNADESFPTPMKHLLIPGTGAFVAFVETASGRKPVTLGKPGTFFFECLKAIAPDINPQKTVMIGDRLNSDIAFGNNNGFRYTIHVQTGVDSLNDVKECIERGEKHLVPSHYINSIADLNKFIDG